MKQALRVVVLSALLVLFAGASPAGIPMYLFQLDGENGGVLTGVVSPGGPVLEPKGHQSSFGAAGLTYVTGRGVTGPDGSVGGLLSNIGLVCVSEMYVAASPVYAGGQARFVMVEADRFGFNIWVGQADGLGIHGAAFQFVAGCVGSTSRMK